MKEIDEKENTFVTQSAEPTRLKPKYVSPSILEAEKYFPTLRPRHYNWTTIKQLVALHHQESESIKFRKSMKLSISLFIFKLIYFLFVYSIILRLTLINCLIYLFSIIYLIYLSVSLNKSWINIMAKSQKTLETYKTT